MFANQLGVVTLNEEGLSLVGDELLIIRGWAVDGLAGVVDEDVEAREGAGEVCRKLLDSGNVPEIEGVDPEALAPGGKVRLLGEAEKGILREASGDKDQGPSAEQLEGAVKPDLDTATSDQGDLAGEISSLGALQEIEVSTLEAEQVVELVHQVVRALANIAAQATKGHVGQLVLNLLVVHSMNLGHLCGISVGKKSQVGLLRSHWKGL